MRGELLFYPMIHAELALHYMTQILEYYSITELDSGKLMINLQRSIHPLDSWEAFYK